MLLHMLMLMPAVCLYCSSLHHLAAIGEMTSFVHGTVVTIKQAGKQAQQDSEAACQDPKIALSVNAGWELGSITTLEASWTKWMAWRLTVISMTFYQIMMWCTCWSGPGPLPTRAKAPAHKSLAMTPEQSAMLKELRCLPLNLLGL